MARCSKASAPKGASSDELGFYNALYFVQWDKVPQTIRLPRHALLRSKRKYGVLIKKLEMSLARIIPEVVRLRSYDRYGSLSLPLSRTPTRYIVLG